MKLKMSRRIRITAFMLAAAALLLSGYMGYQAWKYPGFIDEQIPKYTYKQKAGVDYQVNFRPNMLYEQSSMTGGGPYISKYVRSIDTRMTYSFEGEREAVLEGTYEIKALLQGMVKQADQYKVIWTKTYPLAPQTPFSVQDNALTVEKELPLNYTEYNSFVEKFLEDTRLNTEVKMTVFWNIDTQAQTDSGQIKESFVPVISFGLGRGYFEIEGEHLQERNGALEQTVKTIAPPNLSKIRLYCVLSGLAFISIIFLGFFTAVNNIKANPYTKKRKQILKEHADRLVILQDVMPCHRNNLIRLKTIEDLVRVADELSKPVMYLDEWDSENRIAFYVVTETEGYTYQLRNEEQKEENLIPADSSPALET